jgi:hypothetical protein
VRFHRRGRKPLFNQFLSLLSQFIYHFRTVRFDKIWIIQKSTNHTPRCVSLRPFEFEP